VAFSLSQQMYTPANTQAAIPDRLDQPYAGLLLGNFSLLSETDTSRSVPWSVLAWPALAPAPGICRTASTP